MRAMFGVQDHVVILDHEAELPRNFVLAFFNFRIIEFCHMPAIHTDNVIVMMEFARATCGPSDS